MYAQDAKRIQVWARRSPENLHSVITFVLLSIRHPIEQIPNQFQDVQQNGERSKYLNNHSKRNGYIFARDHAKELYLESLRAWRQKDDIRLLLTFAKVPGLGLVKAGFVAQLAFGRTGCLDTHNLRRFNLDRRAFNVSRASEGTARERAKHYVQACQQCGGTEKLWNSWCEYIANLRYKQTDLFDTDRAAERISKLHLVVME